jgi:hypothetical protein
MITAELNQRSTTRHTRSADQPMPEGHWKASRGMTGYGGRFANGAMLRD